MKFVLENISKNSGRLGHLVHNETGQKLKTPLLLQTTKSGSIPYLSREVFGYVSKNVELLQMSLSTIDEMVESLPSYGDTLSAYVGYKGFPTLLTIRDPCEEVPSGFNDRDIVPLFTRHGKEQLSAKRYMDFVEKFSPDIYLGLCDADTDQESSKRRIQKSVDRTENFMNFCYEHHKVSEKLKNSALFAPIIGGYSTYARTDSIKHAKSQGADVLSGYVLEGFHSYGLTATNLKEDKLIPISRHCLNQLEANKPKFMPGAYTPTLLLELICLGIDLFDTSYAYLAARNFKVLSFNYNDVKTQMGATETPFIDLTDESLKDDFTPFLSNCSCLACQKHTRAYVHHLYKTKELLGHILIMIHNLHHYMQFFEKIRGSISSDTLPNLLALVKYQGQEKAIDYCIQKNTKQISKASFMANQIATENA